MTERKANEARYSLLQSRSATSSFAVELVQGRRAARVSARPRRALDHVELREEAVEPLGHVELVQGRRAARVSARPRRAVDHVALPSSFAVELVQGEEAVEPLRFSSATSSPSTTLIRHTTKVVIDTL